VDRIAGTNLMPSWLPREQYSDDSARAYFYFNLTKDSSYIEKFPRRKESVQPAKKDTSLPKQKIVLFRRPELTEPEKQVVFKKKTITT
jgi:penicillin-binding protein 2